MEKTISWDSKNDSIKMIDQLKLPAEYTQHHVKTVGELVESIKKMRVRGAPALGAAGALGVALAAQNSGQDEPQKILREIRKKARRIIEARPTAVNLKHGAKKVLSGLDQKMSVPEIRNRTLEKAQELTERDVRVNREIGSYGQELLKDGQTVMTHCNAGALAAVGHGTALGIVYSAAEAGKRIEVIVNETRPQNQGARLTAVELEEREINYRLIPDNASGLCLQQDMIDVVVVGADRIVFNGGDKFGDQAVVFNKIGTYKHAVLANRHEVPFVVVAPVSTFDSELSAAEVEIEQRPAEELRKIYNGLNAPPDAPVYNPAFDSTPAELVDYFVTEKGIYEPPLDKTKILATGE